MTRQPLPEELAPVARVGFGLMEQALDLVRRDASADEEQALIERALRELQGQPHQLVVVLAWIHLAWQPLIEGPGAETTFQVVDEEGRPVDPDSLEVSPALICYGRLQATVLAQDHSMATALWNVAVQEGYAAELVILALTGSARQVVSRERHAFPD